MTLAARCRGSPEGCFESGVTTAGGRGAADGLVSGVLFAARRQVASSPSGTGWQAGQRAPARRYRRSTWNLGVHMPGARKRRLGSQKAHDPEELVMSYRRCIQHPGPETPLQWPGLWSEEDVSSPQGSVCDGLPRIRDSKHCRPPDRSIREPSNPSLGAPGRYRSSVPEGCGAGDGLASGGLLAARRTTHSSSHQTRAGKRAKAVAERGYRCSTRNLREPGSGLRAVAWAWERCSKPAQGLSLEHSCASAGSAAARPSPSSCAPFRVWHPKGTEDARRPLSTVSGRLFRIRLGGARGSRCAALAGRARLRTQEEPRALVQMHVLRARGHD